MGREVQAWNRADVADVADLLPADIGEDGRGELRGIRVLVNGAAVDCIRAREPQRVVAGVSPLRPSCLLLERLEEHGQGLMQGAFPVWPVVAPRPVGVDRGRDAQLLEAIYEGRVLRRDPELGAGV